MDVLVGCVVDRHPAAAAIIDHAVRVLDGARLGRHVTVAALGPQGSAVAARLAGYRPRSLVLAGASNRGRSPEAVGRRRLRPSDPVAGDSGCGQPLPLDEVVAEVLRAGVLPARSIVLDVEPGPDPVGAAAALAASVTDEVSRIPLLALGDETRAFTADGGRLEPTEALAALRALLAELDRVDEEGGWGEVFARGADLQRAVAAGATGEGMGCVDWAMWWGLLEELERLGAAGTGGAASAPAPFRH